MGRRVMRIVFWLESQKERDHEEDQHVSGWIILKLIIQIGWGRMDWIHLAEDTEQWRALVNTVMNLRLSSCTTGGFSRRAQFHEVSCQLPSVPFLSFILPLFVQ
jgi:hypothetical protein